MDELSHRYDIVKQLCIEPNLNQMLVEYRDSVAQDRNRLNEMIFVEVQKMTGNELAERSSGLMIREMCAISMN